MADRPELAPWVTPPSFISPPGAPAGPGVAPDRSGAFTPTVPLDPGQGLDVARQVNLPVRVAKPPGGQDFNPGGRFVSIDTAASPFTVFSYVVPEGSVAYLKSLDVGVALVLSSSLLSFAIQVDGSPISGWENLLVPGAALSYFSKAWSPDEMFQRVEPGKTVSVIFRVDDAGSYDGVANLHGWTVPQQLADASDGAWR